MASNPLECPACHGATSRWTTKAASELRACPACRTVSAVIPEERESEGDPYDGIYSRNDLDIPDVVRASLDALMASLEAYRHTNNLCDIGFGAGLLLTTAEERGWRCHGTETSTVAIERAHPRVGGSSMRVKQPRWRPVRSTS